MSISEKANDLLNKFGSAQFDFMVWNTPDNLTALCGGCTAASMQTLFMSGCRG